MKTTIKLLIGLSLILATSIGTAAEQKFGYVDMQAALKSTKAGKKAKSTLEGLFKKKQADLKKREKSLKKMNEELEKKSLAMTDKVKAKKTEEFQAKFREYQQLVAKSQQEIQKKERDIMMPILKKMKTVVQDIAKSKKYTFVFEKNEQLVLYADSTVDITKQVVKAFEKKK